MKKGTSKALTKEQKEELQALAALSDEQIDASDIPEILDWSGAERGLLYRPVKRQITLRLDADVVAWFKANAPGGRGYQTEMNRVLRKHAQRTLNTRGYRGGTRAASKMLRPGTKSGNQSSSKSPGT